MKTFYYLLVILNLVHFLQILKLYNFEKVNFMCERYMRDNSAHDVAEDICEAFKAAGYSIRGYEEHKLERDSEPEFLPGF